MSVNWLIFKWRRPTCKPKCIHINNFVNQLLLTLTYIQVFSKMPGVHLPHGNFLEIVQSESMKSYHKISSHPIYQYLHREHLLILDIWCVNFTHIRDIFVQILNNPILSKSWYDSALSTTLYLKHSLISSTNKIYEFN